ncbi:MAG: nucleotide exchange factor GrpE, partial [Dehalococcoidia bacterium]|nr:nucleotide exchange factor GrpE [Dehalococcoidia bacterium]
IMYGEGEEGTVISEVQKGYRLYDRIIRPAMVIVGQGKGKQDSPNDEEPAQS